MKRSFWIIFCLVVSQSFLFPVVAIDSRSATQEIDLQIAGTALLAISGPPVILKMAGATEAGDSISQAAENNESRLRISSLVSENETRSITARISDVLVGTELYVDLQSPNANFARASQMGRLKGIQLLSNELDATLVEGIGTCWSGKSEGDGYVIKYTYKAIQGASIIRGGIITITYTISRVASDPVE